MKRQLNRTDLLFAISLILTLLFISNFIFTVPYSHDETFYLTIPFRIIKGDSLINDEWHLTQFSSFFSYLPTLLWMKIKGSAEGIVVFSRFVYYLIQTILAIAVYLTFRKYKVWAIIASVLYLTQFVNIMQQISYHSMFVSFLLLLSLSIVSIYKNNSKILYLSAGVCYGLCCISNPLFCFVFIFYIILYIFWKHRKNIAEVFYKSIKTIENRRKHKHPKPIKKTHKKKKQKKAKIEKSSIFFETTESFSCFFSRQAICCSFIGLLMISSVAVVFFFATGATIPSIFANAKNLLDSSEYSSSLLDKIIYAFNNLNDLTTNKVFFIPLLFILILLDKKRTKKSHRFVYLIATFLLSAIYFTSIFSKVTDDIYFFEFPFMIFSTVCYLITKSKNKHLFYCMWLPCTIASIFHLLASASSLSAMNVVLITSNIAGVFFVADLFKETHIESKQFRANKKITLKFSRYIACVALCLQIICHLSFFQVALYTPKSTVKVTTGPYTGILMTEQQFDDYTKSITDLNMIKSRLEPDSPVYIAAWQNWMYLYLERPVGAYTSYYGNIDTETLRTYYEQNPDHIPQYVYVPTVDYFNNMYYEYPTDEILETLREMFDFRIEILSRGLLLNVTQYKHIEKELQNHNQKNIIP